MTTTQQIFFWGGLLAITIAAFALLSEILLPFIIGFAIAYMLNPLAEWLERFNISRTGAAVLIITLFGVLFLLLLLFLLPALFTQLAAFVSDLPSYIQKVHGLLIRTGGELFGDKFKTMVSPTDSNLSDIVKQATQWAANPDLLQAVWSSGMALVNFFSLLFVTPVVTFFLVKDWEKMMRKVDSWLPRQHAPTIRQLGLQIDRAIDGFIRGQALVALSLDLFYALALSLTGLNHALLIGLGAGLLSFIPFAGTLAGFVTATVTALGQFWPDYVPIAMVIGIFVTGQIIEGNFLSPKIIGDRVQLHPVWLIMALFVFGYLFGFAGLLVAVPVAAALGVLVRFGLKKYLESPFYLGSTPQEPLGRACDSQSRP